MSKKYIRLVQTCMNHYVIFEEHFFIPEPVTNDELEKFAILENFVEELNDVDYEDEFGFTDADERDLLRFITKNDNFIYFEDDLIELLAKDAKHQSNNYFIAEISNTIFKLKDDDDLNENLKLFEDHQIFKVKS